MDNASLHNDGKLPSTSVVVPVLNGAATIGDTLHALLQQVQVPDQLQIIVVDNGSTDGTREIVRCFDVQLLEEATRGPAAARNCGLQQAKGDVVVYLDADTLPTRSWLAEMVAPFCDPRTTLVAGRLLSFPATTPAERYISRFQFYDAEQNINREVLPFASSANMAVRRDVALSVGGWCEEMLTSEDLDFSTRVLAKHPQPIAYAPKAVLFHRNRDTDERLQHMAWTYGEGVADTYRRYPDQLQWGLRQRVHLAWTLAVRCLTPRFLSLSHRIGATSAQDLEHAHYRWMWTRFYWRGFFSFWSSAVRRDPWV